MCGMEEGFKNTAFLLHPIGHQEWVLQFLFLIHSVLVRSSNYFFLNRVRSSEKSNNTDQ